MLIKLFGYLIIVLLLNIFYPFFIKLIMSSILIHILLYIFFLKKRIQLASNMVKACIRLRSYRILRKKIFQVINKEIEKSRSFKYYLKYRQFVYLILLDQRNCSDRADIINPFKPITRIFTFRICQVIVIKSNFNSAFSKNFKNF